MRCHSFSKLSSTFAILFTLFTFTQKAGAQSQNKTHSKIDVDVEARKKGGKKEDRVDTKPQLAKNQSFIIATEVKLIGEIRKAIEYLNRTERRMPKNSPARLEMLEKLVNLHLEQAVYVANTEMRNYENAYERWENGNKKGPPPKINNRESNGEWRKVIERAEYLMREFPRSKNADVTMFNMGVAQQFIGKEKEAARTYSTLIQKYPSSQKAGEAHFQLGDYYFDKLDFRNASNNYKQALRYRQSKSYTWSLFKLGWCSYNLGDFPGSLNYWRQTVIAAKSSDNKGTVQLKDEALRDMVFAFAELRQVEPAIAYYRANGGEKYIAKFLLLLSQTFSDQGKYAEAIKTLKRFQQVAPNAPEAPDTQKDIIGLFYDLSRYSSVWVELENFPKMFGPESRWAQANAQDRKRVLEVQATIKEQMLYYAKLTHKASQKTDSVSGYAEALKGYNLFLRFYPSSKEVAEVKFLMADIYYIQKNYKESGKYYLEVALLGKENAVVFDPQTKKSENIHQKSSRYMLDSYGLGFEPQYRILLKTKPDFSKPPRPLTAEAKNYVKACEYYKQWYPSDKKSAKECDVYVTAVFYRNQDKVASRKFLYVLATKYPNEKEGPAAVEELIPLYKDDKKALVKLSEELLKIPAYQKGALGQKLQELQRGAQIEEIGKISDTGKRAKAYEDQAKRNPKGKDADKLYYNAATDYLKAGMMANAMAAYVAIIKGYPKSEQVKDSVIQLAKLYEKRFDFINASTMYMQFASRFPKEKEALPSIGKACELEVAIGSANALKVCMNLAKFDADGAKSFVARMIREAEFAKNYNRMVQLITQTYMKFKLTADERMIALHKIYKAYKGRGAPGQQAAQQMLQVFKQSGPSLSGESSRYAAEIIFLNAGPAMQKYVSIKLAGGTVDALAASIQRKVIGIQSVQKAYDQVLATKNAYWGVAALYQLGYAREVLARELQNPPGIKGASIEDVKKQLSNDAMAASAEAKKFYASAYESIEKYSVYNDWAARVVSGLARASGQKVTFDDIVLRPDYIESFVPSSVASAVEVE